MSPNWCLMSSLVTEPSSEQGTQANAGADSLMWVDAQECLHEIGSDASTVDRDECMCEREETFGNCVLCLNLGGESNAPLDIACDYVYENVGRVSTAVMFAQVRQVVQGMGMQISLKQIELHFKVHAPIPKLVHQQLLADLYDFAAVAKRESIVVQEETGARAMNPKTCSVYLDTVKQIINLMKVNKQTTESATANIAAATATAVNSNS